MLYINTNTEGSIYVWSSEEDEICEKTEFNYKINNKNLIHSKKPLNLSEALVVKTIQTLRHLRQMALQRF